MSNGELKLFMFVVSFLSSRVRSRQGSYFKPTNQPRTYCIFRYQNRAHTKGYRRLIGQYI